MHRNILLAKLEVGAALHNDRICAGSTESAKLISGPPLGLDRQKHEEGGTEPDSSASKPQDPVGVAVNVGTGSNRRNDAGETSECAAETGCRSSDGCREDLGSESVQAGVEKALSAVGAMREGGGQLGFTEQREQLTERLHVLEGIQTDTGLKSVDLGVHRHGDTLHDSAKDQRPLATEASEFDEAGSKEDAENTREVDVDAIGQYVNAVLSKGGGDVLTIDGRSR